MAKEEEIRASIDDMDSEILKDTLAILLAKTNPTQNITKTEIQTNYQNFAQAILDLKRKYKFPELNNFSTEADLVYVQAGDRRILLTDKDAQLAMTRPAIETQEQSSSDKQNEEPVKKDSIENAFENIKPNDSRFSHLEF